MRHAVYIIAAVLLLVFGSALAFAQATAPPAPPRIVSVAVTTAAVRETSSTRTDALLLWNRNERALPIGHAVKACIKVGSGGIFGNGLYTCTMVISLPLGKVTATGIVHNLRRYTLIITGGTRLYENTTGPLFVRSVSGDGVRRLTFTL